ncbi:Endoribonuclease L-PSP [Candidatus Koribacter versatilis Ellin345]|uniref:Endoribonuclease L-PSP n=1 Tax=Koribacter versatilis (strain Ellin345) TaxID=204669 RepID=Q1III5_KORVE|nr:RidA family protein [Candidatus Koribacter versatilis]ABF43315.1 Endoribonuclease L-PSP [Candidatus Koribacter versatilis Ellin345]
MKSTINLPSRRNNLPFSDAVRVGETVYLSGRIGFKPGTTEIPADAGEEAKYLLDGIREVLEQAGMVMDDLAYVQIFTPDVSLFDTFNKVYATYFEEEFPARAFLGSGPLLFGARFELIAIAAK